MADILEKLQGGDRRSIGRADEVVQDVLHDPALFGALFQGMLNQDPLICMRAADAVEKITAHHPDYLEPFRDVFLLQIARSPQQEVRWHVAQMIPRLTLNAEERDLAVATLIGYLEDKSIIVKANTLQALADLSEGDATLRARLIPLLQTLIETGSPAIKSRGRKLLKTLDSAS